MSDITTIDPGGVSSATHSASSGGREKFAAHELAIVLSHFDIGVIKEIREFPRGSRKAPKLYVESESGTFLLKRRARGRDDAIKVAFSHQIQLHLAAQQYPLPHLIGTRRENNSMLQLGESIYELFEYIPGQGYNLSLEATNDSGRVLALFHKLLDGFNADYHPPMGSYHNAPAVEQGLITIGRNARDPKLRARCDVLADRYRECTLRVEGLGLNDWPSQIVHADWHPGNMLFRDNRVVAVIDYDSARQLPRIIDTANGALQFSIVGDEHIDRWPDSCDEGRLRRFVRGYDQVIVLSQAELDAMPFLMIEALIAESVFPILATGSFQRFDGASFLAMVDRKTNWLRQHSKRLIGLISE